MKFQTFILAVGMIANALRLDADTIVFKSGAIVKGTVLQTNQTTIFFRRENGTFNYPVEAIKQIKKDVDTNRSSALSTNRIPAWGKIIGDLVRQPWAYGAKQIPATVIDYGIFKHVPYCSFHVGSNYELNVYGDPENPAGVEMGIYRDVNGKDEVAKENCIEFIALTMREPLDKEVIRKLNRNEDVSGREGFVFEVTPPTAVDAYGGWWVSIYDEDKVNAARATDKELKEISESASVSEAFDFNPNDSKWSNAEKKEARVIRIILPPKPSETASDSAVTSFRPDSSSDYSSSRVSSGGSVYVRGYTRKDGTYVHSYSRRR